MPIVVIDTVEPKNDAFEDIVKMEHVGYGNLAVKSSPVGGDIIAILDSEDSNSHKYVTVSNLSITAAAANAALIWLGI